MRKGFYFLCQSLQKFSTLLIFLHFVGLRQCGKSCCLRWLNHLRPDIKHGSFTEEEDSTICSLYNQMGSRQFESAEFCGFTQLQSSFLQAISTFIVRCINSWNVVDHIAICFAVGCINTWNVFDHIASVCLFFTALAL
ncbi:hypothetical protein ACFX1R_010840 [Malus domestica]